MQVLPSDWSQLYHLKYPQEGILLPLYLLFSSLYWQALAYARRANYGLRSFYVRWTSILCMDNFPHYLYRIVHKNFLLFWIKCGCFLGSYVDRILICCFSICSSLCSTLSDYIYVSICLPYLITTEDLRLRINQVHAALPPVPCLPLFNKLWEILPLLCIFLNQPTFILELHIVSHFYF